MQESLCKWFNEMLKQSSFIVIQSVAAYRKSSDRRRALNRRQASNTGQARNLGLHTGRPPTGNWITCPLCRYLDMASSSDETGKSAVKWTY